MKNFVLLKKGKEKSLKNFHPWIFSGAIESLPEFENGEILPVLSFEKEFLGHAYFNKNSSIIGRMVNFSQENPIDSILKNLSNAIDLRKKFFDNSTTNAYRLINAEGDFLPGLVVDKYDKILVFQITTLGIEKLKPTILDFFIKNLKPDTIYEKSNSPARAEEDLAAYENVLYGKKPEKIFIKENGYGFKINLQTAQKTGFFLDQKDSRQLIKNLSLNKNVLNCFGYTGAFSVYALHGGAKKVTTVDLSKTALSEAEENLSLNGFDKTKNPCVCANVFDFLRTLNAFEYEIIILDPPAFCKKSKDVIEACRAYKDINRLAIKNIAPGGILLTCSCSHFVNEELFQKVIFQAAAEAKRNVQIIQKHHLAYDHPINIYHPESAYLKSFVLYVL